MSNAGVAIGTSSVDIENISDTYIDSKKSAFHKISPYFLPKILLSMPSANVAMKFQFKVPLLYSTQCTLSLTQFVSSETCVTLLLVILS